MSRRGAFVAGWVLALLAMAAFASLGRWQLARMEHKQAMLDSAAATLQARDARPLSIAADRRPTAAAGPACAAAFRGPGRCAA